ncbi:hypothetical protein ACJJTC_005677 [Scirpophaga incertulas]
MERDQVRSSRPKQMEVHCGNPLSTGGHRTIGPLSNSSAETIAPLTLTLRKEGTARTAKRGKGSLSNGVEAYPNKAKGKPVQPIITIQPSNSASYRVWASGSDSGGGVVNRVRRRRTHALSNARAHA